MSQPDESPAREDEREENEKLKEVYQNTLDKYMSGRYGGIPQANIVKPIGGVIKGEYLTRLSFLASEYRRHVARVSADENPTDALTRVYMLYDLLEVSHPSFWTRHFLSATEQLYNKASLLMLTHESQELDDVLRLVYAKYIEYVDTARDFIRTTLSNMMANDRGVVDGELVELRIVRYMVGRLPALNVHAKHTDAQHHLLQLFDGELLRISLTWRNITERRLRNKRPPDWLLLRWKKNDFADPNRLTRWYVASVVFEHMFSYVSERLEHELVHYKARQRWYHHPQLDKTCAAQLTRFLHAYIDHVRAELNELKDVHREFENALGDAGSSARLYMYRDVGEPLVHRTAPVLRAILDVVDIFASERDRATKRGHLHIRRAVKTGLWSADVDTAQTLPESDTSGSQGDVAPLWNRVFATLEEASSSDRIQSMSIWNQVFPDSESASTSAAASMDTLSQLRECLRIEAKRADVVVLEDESVDRLLQSMRARLQTAESRLSKEEKDAVASVLKKHGKKFKDVFALLNYVAVDVFGGAGGDVDAQRAFIQSIDRALAHHLEGRDDDDNAVRKFLYVLLSKARAHQTSVLKILAGTARDFVVFLGAQATFRSIAELANTARTIASDEFSVLHEEEYVLTLTEMQRFIEQMADAVSIPAPKRSRARVSCSIAQAWLVSELLRLSSANMDKWRTRMSRVYFRRAFTTLTSTLRAEETKVSTEGYSGSTMRMTVASNMSWLVQNVEDVFGDQLPSVVDIARSLYDIVDTMFGRSTRSHMAQFREDDAAVMIKSVAENRNTELNRIRYVTSVQTWKKMIAYMDSIAKELEDIRNVHFRGVGGEVIRTYRSNEQKILTTFERIRQHFTDQYDWLPLLRTLMSALIDVWDTCVRADGALDDVWRAARILESSVEQRRLMPGVAEWEADTAVHARLVWTAFFGKEDSCNFRQCVEGFMRALNIDAKDISTECSAGTGDARRHQLLPTQWMRDQMADLMRGLRSVYDRKHGVALIAPPICMPPGQIKVLKTRFAKFMHPIGDPMRQWEKKMERQQGRKSEIDWNREWTAEEIEKKRLERDLGLPEITRETFGRVMTSLAQVGSNATTLTDPHAALVLVKHNVLYNETDFSELRRMFRAVFVLHLMKQTNIRLMNVIESNFGGNSWVIFNNRETFGNFLGLIHSLFPDDVIPDDLMDTTAHSIWRHYLMSLVRRYMNRVIATSIRNWPDTTAILGRLNGVLMKLGSIAMHASKNNFYPRPEESLLWVKLFQVMEEHNPRRTSILLDLQSLPTVFWSLFRNTLSFLATTRTLYPEGYVNVDALIGSVMWVQSLDVVTQDELDLGPPSLRNRSITLFEYGLVQHQIASCSQTPNKMVSLDELQAFHTQEWFYDLLATARELYLVNISTYPLYQLDPDDGGMHCVLDTWANTRQKVLWNKIYAGRLPNLDEDVDDK